MLQDRQPLLRLWFRPTITVLVNELSSWIKLLVFIFGLDRRRTSAAAALWCRCSWRCRSRLLCRPWSGLEYITTLVTSLRLSPKIGTHRIANALQLTVHLHQRLINSTVDLSFGPAILKIYVCLLTSGVCQH